MISLTTTDGMEGPELAAPGVGDCCGTKSSAPALVTTVRNGGYLFVGDVKDV